MPVDCSDFPHGNLRNLNPSPLKLVYNSNSISFWAIWLLYRLTPVERIPSSRTCMLHCVDVANRLRAGLVLPWSPQSHKSVHVSPLPSSCSVRGLPCRGTCSTATATWTTCRACGLSTSCTPRWSRRWRRCSSTTCPGSRCSSWRRPWTCSASAAPRSCSPMYLLSTSRRTTSLLYLR